MPDALPVMFVCPRPDHARTCAGTVERKPSERPGRRTNRDDCPGVRGRARRILIVSATRREAARALVLASIVGALAYVPASVRAGTIETYRGPCDASAAVALDRDRFVVGNDENDVLSTYRRGTDLALNQADLASFLGTRRKEESDIEGAASVGSRVYWITSHGRNARGAEQPSRHRLFATESRPGEPPAIAPVGTPYRGLLRDLVDAPALAPWRLAESSTRAAEAEGGLNIEGLAATPDGRLLVGFRNPLREGRALVVPIDNPAEVVAGARARLGAPIALELGGRGIRSMELVGSAYVIVAGPIADRGSFALFRWSGAADDAPVAVAVDLGTLRPEALFAPPGADDIVLLSDDGGVEVDGKACKDLRMPRQTFRALTLPR